MVVVVIIGLIAAMAMPAYRHITMRSKTTAVINDFRAFSTALVAYDLQNGHWPADAAPALIPPEMVGALPDGFTLRTPIGGVYQWASGETLLSGPAVTAAIVIESDATNGNFMSDDLDQLQMIDDQMDDGTLTSGNVQLGAANTLVLIVER